MAKNRLTGKEKLFCQLYVTNGNGTQAAIGAKYSAASAGQKAYTLLKKDYIQVEIQRLRDKISKKHEISAERVTTEYARIAFADFTQIIDKMVKNVAYFKDLTELPDDLRHCVSSIKNTKDGFEVKFWSKINALDSLGKHLNLFKDHEKAGAGNIIIRPSDEIDAEENQALLEEEE